MKKQLNQLRRFFARTGTRKLNAATAREVIPASYDDDDGSNRLSGAFIVVLLLHVIALVGVFAFSRMKDPKPAAGQSANGAPANTPAAAPAAAKPAPALPQPEPAAIAAQAAPAATSAATRNASLAATEAAIVNDRVASPSRATTSASGRSYVVKSGDNLTKIAVAYGIRPADLIAANNLKNDEIKPGQELTIPSKAAAAESKTPTRVEKPAVATTTKAGSYTVRKNDSVVKIARDLGVNYEDLIKVNNIKDPKKLQEGQILKVPRKS